LCHEVVPPLYQRWVVMVPSVFKVPDAALQHIGSSYTIVNQKGSSDRWLAMSCTRALMLQTWQTWSVPTKGGNPRGRCILWWSPSCACIPRTVLLGLRWTTSVQVSRSQIMQLTLWRCIQKVHYVYRYLQDKYAILSQKGLAAAEEIAHVFVPNTFDHLAEPSTHFHACISSLVIYFSHIYQETKSSCYVTYSTIAVFTLQEIN